MAQTTTQIATVLFVHWLLAQSVLVFTLFRVTWLERWSGFIRVDEDDNTYSHVTSPWEAAYKQFHKHRPRGVRGWGIFFGYPFVPAIVLTIWYAVVTWVTTVVA